MKPANISLKDVHRDGSGLDCTITGQNELMLNAFTIGSNLLQAVLPARLICEALEGLLYGQLRTMVIIARGKDGLAELLLRLEPNGHLMISLTKHDPQGLKRSRTCSLAFKPQAVEKLWRTLKAIPVIDGFGPEAA